MRSYYIKTNNKENIENDEGWHEEIIDKNSRRYKFFQIAKALVAFIVLAGLLYISGIYQSTFFTQTPSDAEPADPEVLAEGETMELPLIVVDVAEEKNIGRTKTKEEINSLVNKASTIWKQAKIELTLKEYVTINVSKEEMTEYLIEPRRLLNKVNPREKKGVVVFLLHSLRGINGIAFVGNNTVALAEFTSVYNFRVLAHEVGHILGLSHVVANKRLMDKEARGEKLTKEEVVRARQTLSDYIK
jgi:hypothetical protein